MTTATAILQNLHFLRPYWLWALLGLPLLAWWWRAHRRQRSVWREVVDPHLLPHLLEENADGRARGALVLGLLGGLVAVCALAGPSWQRSAQPLWQSRTPLVIALDLSSATLASDLPPSRLLQARAKIATLLDRRAGGQVGLVAFADDAYTVAPLTDDAGNVALFLDALAPDVMPVDGSHADRAIDWAVKLLGRSGFDHGDILLLSDHADAAARRAAAAAARDGFRVSVLGLGSIAGAAYRDANGRIAETHLDAASLRALANAGGGGYATLAAGDRDLASLGVLDPRQAGATAARGEKTATWLDQGYWLLPPLLLLALLAFRRGGALAVVLLCCCLPWQPVQAAENDWWLRPDQKQHARMERGVQAYRSSDFSAAEKSWEGLPGADAAYNRGNALAKNGDYDAAIAAYDEALRQQPGMDDAIANKRAVEAAKKRKPPSGQKQGNGNQQQKGDQGRPRSGQDQGNQKSPSQSGGQGSQDHRQPPPPAARSPKPGGNDQQAKPAKPGDPASQRAADAAQRERMQRALQQAKQGQSPTQALQRSETPAQRERRIANEAWLRRVPDDPGGLLRAKLRLEYERRQQGGQ